MIGMCVWALSIMYVMLKYKQKKSRQIEWQRNRMLLLLNEGKSEYGPAKQKYW